MESQEFQEQLGKASDLLKEEKYKECIIILEKLKKIEQKGDFDYDYSLTHQLYQLYSNSHSFYNQNVIKTYIDETKIKQESITFHDLNKLIKENTELDLEDSILRREIELLILRNILSCGIEGDSLKF